MTNEKEQDRLEFEKIKLERFKIWGRIITAAITVVFGSAIAAYINYQIQTRQLDQQVLLNNKELELQKKKAEADISLQEARAEADRRQAEMKYLGEFTTFALEDDYNKRLRFADYFAELTLSDELKTNWQNYRQGLVDKQKEFEDTKVLLAKAKEEKNVKKVEELTTMVVQQQAQLVSIRDNPEVPVSLEKISRFLDKDRKPRKYTDNDFTLETINGDKVVIDQATGLTWQQSGSEKQMIYKEAKAYINKLNREKFAGFSDWRLPTLEEAITLLEETEQNGDLYIDPVFEKNQRWILTSDLYSTSSAWVVNFNDGYCYNGYFVNNFVRSVR
ncbi:MAG: DUF1566 domain-containing protein [Candidatus Brocadiales bacterium]|nr:DUF1566 domain-containing protein [Candidatus Brocadiales bacterium]